MNVQTFEVLELDSGDDVNYWLSFLSLSRVKEDRTENAVVDFSSSFL